MSKGSDSQFAPVGVSEMTAMEAIEHLIALREKLYEIARELYLGGEDGSTPSEKDACRKMDEAYVKLNIALRILQAQELNKTK